MWRSCILTPLHSLTSPVAQPFASCLVGSNSRLGGTPILLELGFSTPGEFSRGPWITFRDLSLRVAPLKEKSDHLAIPLKNLKDHK
jgi:hypothetical protein